MKKLCVTGSLHLDVVVNSPHFPRSDETVTGTKVNYIFGGHFSCVWNFAQTRGIAYDTQTRFVLPRGGGGVREDSRPAAGERDHASSPRRSKNKS